MSDDTAIFVGASDADQFLLLKYANRHGLIAGATGTGKTVTLQTIAEGFSAYGVPVLMADVKGHLSGGSQPVADNPHAVERAHQRAWLTLQQQGGERFCGEPALDLKDMIGRDASGAGYVNVLAADKLMQSPRLYSTFLLWLLSELFQVMPEVGDVDRPKFVFFFDEAHLLFDDAPKALLDK